MIEINNIAKQYNINGKKISALMPLSMAIKEGEALFLLGPNGVGKTTAIKILSGLIKQTTGSVFLKGISIQKKKQYLANIGAVLEGTRNIYHRLTPIENMELFCNMRGARKRTVLNRIDYYIEQLGLGQYRDTECRFLSRGNQQKTAIGCALVLNAKCLLLDEPTLGLDVELSYRMMKLLDEEKTNGRILLITSHDSEFIENVADRLVILRHNHSPIITTSDYLIKKYGEECQRLSKAYINFMGTA